ncbi:flagellar hook-length control protein FliK [Anaerosacchariphilus polymeriproducens]|nr:flagellar hook-length control protein FliK [Anaerosacchariphilus polymeriproducens]
MIISTSNGIVLSNTNLEQNTTTSDITSLLLKQVSSVNFDVSKLLVGDVFQGLITDVRKNEVTIQINGQNLNAHLEESINLNIGQNISFKVQNNDGKQISIKPMPSINNGNEVFAKVLSQAGVPITERNIEMVKTMMSEQMAVDKKSIMEMVKQISKYPDQEPATIIQMSKLTIPITQENICQFENYKNFEHKIDQTMNQVVDEFIPVLSEAWKDGSRQPDELLRMQFEIIEVFQEQEGNKGETQLLKEIFTAKEIKSFTEQLRGLGFLPEVLEEVKSGNISSNDTLDLIKQTLGKLETYNFPEGALKKLFSGKEFKVLLKNHIENNWFIRPEELLKEKKIEDMYKQLYRQIDKMEEIVDNLTKGEQSLSKNLTSIKTNMDFMNQVNQFMNYVQIPLKMLNQKAHSDLYVFTNKKKLSQKEGKLSALLHLDMEAMGPLDIYIQLENNKVDTQFFVEDTISFDLIIKNTYLLTSRLEAKGYECTVEMKERKKTVDFVEDFLKHEQQGNKIQRYSFDVRA